MPEDLPRFHGSPADRSDPTYWIDYATDDLAYRLLGDVLAGDAGARRREAVAFAFRDRLGCSPGLARLIRSRPSVHGVERVLCSCSHVFLAQHHPDLARSVAQDEMARLRCEESRMLRAAARTVSPHAPQLAAALECEARDREADAASASARALGEVERLEREVGLALLRRPRETAREIARDLAAALTSRTVGPVRAGVARRVTASG